LRERRDNWASQHSVIIAEMEAAEQQDTTWLAELDAVRSTAISLEARLVELQSRIRDAESSLAEWDRRRHEHATDAHSAKVELARSEQQADMLRARMTQFQEDQRERSRAILDATNQLNQGLERCQATDREILRDNAALAELLLAKEACHRERQRQLATRDALVAERTQFASRIQSLRKKAVQVDEALHRKDLLAHDLRHQRQALVERLREDYGIEIEQLTASASAEELAERTQIEAEIAELRGKLSHLGSVNMEALAELDELESRYQALHAQYVDLVDAKEALEKIIHKINADSRRLFQDTLEAIRVNFQALYRKAFGGGRADIVLEENVDPLEAGVELFATPPGKPQFNNSLLSGGEKALTAVALLLAIFQFRPSPFCVLDEVDAPFDEANIGRFVDVLRGFLGWTKFVIVTHSKKTMTAATTLYGVTMQESGVSKRVSVRFEDVSEDGHIAPDALDRDERRMAA
ncbi:MAG: chromosome segregation protein SMC, partial [Pirellulaceae bacterium]